MRWNSPQTKGDISVTLSGNLSIDKGLLSTDISGRVASSSPNLKKIIKVVNTITVDGFGFATGKAKVGKIYSKTFNASSNSFFCDLYIDEHINGGILNYDYTIQTTVYTSTGAITFRVPQSAFY